MIEPEALHLVGASSKRNDSSKIGQFGSGNKYAMAYLLRNGYELKVFSGTTEIKITTQKSTFRGDEYNVVYIDGEKTSITTEMGKDWQFWQALREIYCNAIDEGDFSMDFVQNMEPVEGETHFYIDTKKDVMEFVSNFDNYFAQNKEVLFECEQGRILKKEPGIANVYRKGIKCYETNKNSIFDYDISNISIDENRLVSYSWKIPEKIWDLIYRCTNKEVIMQVLHQSGDSNFLEGAIGDFSDINSSNISAEFKECLKGINVCPKSFGGLLKPDEVHNHIIVPTKVFEAVRGHINDENVGESFRVGRGGSLWRQADLSELHLATLKQAEEFFKEVGCEEMLTYEIIGAIFDSKDILGYANKADEQIVLSDICLDRGINEVVNTIIEEYIHLKHGVKDNSRGFQTAIISEFISYMKKINSYVI